MKTGIGKFLGWLSLAAIFSFNAVATTFYVNVSNIVPVSPFTDWSTAATNIQDAIDASSDGDLILVTNGVYAKGGRVVYGSLTNRVVINKAVVVQSINGAAFTIIQGNRVIGGNAVRCVYLTNNAILNGFTLTNGATQSIGDLIKERSGAGVWCEATNSLVLNCLIITNMANIYGGGAYSGTLSNCTIARNSASNLGGGAYLSALKGCSVSNNNWAGIAYCAADNSLINDNKGISGGGATYCTLLNCIISGNNAGYGGGADFSVLTNCLVIGNTSNEAGGGLADGSIVVGCTVVSNLSKLHPSECGLDASCRPKNCIIYYNNTGNYSGTFASNCCLTPLPSAGVGNITNAPAFMNLAAGDFHLQSTSPCINAGNNAYVPNPTDLDGNPRIVGGTVDIGAYEFQSPASMLSYAWAQQYGLPMDGSADSTDTDGDGMNNWQEWKASTVPTNAASLLQLASPSNSLSGMIVKWQSVSGVNYYLQRSTNLAAQPAFTSIKINIVGQVGTTSYTDTTATNVFPCFYRVSVQ